MVLALLGGLVALVPASVRGQADSTILDRVIPAAVQIAIVGTTIEQGVSSETYIPVASGTVVSPMG